MNLKKIRILLASASPRRKELIKKLGVKYRIIEPQMDEEYPDGMEVAEIPAYLARMKAEATRDQLQPGEWLLTADTVVVLNGEIIEKPRSRAEAIDHLMRLNGKRHTVISGVCMILGPREILFSDFTDVYFRKLSSEIIEYYVDHFNPMDKAGAYGIQDWFGMVGIEKIKGNYFNVMGLPVYRVYETLEKFK